MKLSNTMMINEKLLPTAKRAFTLAEVLITLSILGVVAALTIPTLVNRQSDMAARTRISKAISSYEDMAAIYMAENDASDLRDLTCAQLTDYFKMVNTANNGCDFVTADGVAWSFQQGTGFMTAVDTANASAGRYAVSMWAQNGQVNGTGQTDRVANNPATYYQTLYNGASLINGRQITPAGGTTGFLQGTYSGGQFPGNGADIIAQPAANNNGGNAGGN